MSEWSSIVFTISIQGAVGTFVTLALIDLLIKPRLKSMSFTFVAILIMLAAGFFSSYYDKGQALRIMLPGQQIGSIQLPPLDIIALVLFSLTTAAYAFSRVWGTNLTQQMILLPSMTIGIVLVLITSQSYSPIPTSITSNGWTLFQFTVTTLLTGPIITITLLHWQQKKIDPPLLNTIGKKLAIVSLIAATITLVGFTVYLFWVSTLELPDNPLNSLDNGYFLVAARILLALAGVQILSITTLCDKHNRTLASTCLVLLLLAEFFGRAFFFSVHQETTLVSSNVLGYIPMV